MQEISHISIIYVHHHQHIINKYIFIFHVIYYCLHIILFKILICITFPNSIDENVQMLLSSCTYRIRKLGRPLPFICKIKYSDVISKICTIFCVSVHHFKISKKIFRFTSLFIIFDIFIKIYSHLAFFSLHC